MPVRPNPIPVMLRELEQDMTIAAMCVDARFVPGGTLIFGGKIPPAVVDMMPVSCVVLTEAGGFKDIPDLPVHSYRIQATCYGGGDQPGASDEASAATLASAVADALDGRNSIYDFEVPSVIKYVELVGGPTQVKDVDMNNTPAQVLFFRVLMPTIPLS